MADKLKLHLPGYLGGYEVEFEGEPLADDEEVVGWADEYGTITSAKVNKHIGDLVYDIRGSWTLLVMKKEQNG